MWRRSFYFVLLQLQKLLITLFSYVGLCLNPKIKYNKCVLFVQCNNTSVITGLESLCEMALKLLRREVPNCISNDAWYMSFKVGVGLIQYKALVPCLFNIWHSPSGSDKSYNQCVCVFFFTACNFVYLNAVPIEMLTGPCAVQKAVSSTLQKAVGSLKPAIVNMKVSLKGVTLTDVNRK